MEWVISNQSRGSKMKTTKSVFVLSYPVQSSPELRNIIIDKARKQIGTEYIFVVLPNWTGEFHCEIIKSV
jgi:hypothetical protein